MAIRSNVLRAIAAAELEKIFPGQAPEAREELITSVVRQWLTCDRHAGVFTIPVHYWLHLVEQGTQVLAGMEVVPGSLPGLLGPWLIVERDLPRVVWELSVAQSSTFVNAEGVTVRVRADAKEHGFGVEEVHEEGDEDQQ